MLDLEPNIHQAQHLSGVELCIFDELLHAKQWLPHKADGNGLLYKVYACLDESRLIAGSGEEALIPTGFGLDMSKTPGTFALLISRMIASASARKQMPSGNSVCVIDQSFTQEIYVSLHNNNRSPHYIKPGEHIANLVFVSASHVDFFITGSTACRELRPVTGELKTAKRYPI